jgi:hypothetical protein
MAGTYSPTITTFPDALLTADSLGDTSYDEIVSSLKANVYVCDSADIQASSTSQLNELIYVNEYDSNGDLINHVITPDTDPYQFQKSLKLEFKGEGLILDGRTSLGVDLLANSSTQIDFNSGQFDPSDTEEIIQAEDSGSIDKLKKESLDTLLTEKALKNTAKTFDYDLLNRSGLVDNAYTKLENGQSISLYNLFEGFVDEI